MKKLCALLLSVVMIFTFALFAMGSGEDTSEDQGSGTAENSTDKSNLGNYQVDIQSCRLAKDFEGKDVVIVKYLFKNVSSNNAAAFYIAIDESVYQNGVGLNEAFILADSANYSSDNQTKEIKKGASIEVEVAYELNDTTSDIEVEVKELISFNNTVIKKTFSITK